MATTQVPVEMVEVARWDAFKSLQRDNQDAPAYIVQTNLQDYRRYRVRMKEHFLPLIRTLYPNWLDNMNMDDFKIKVGFVKGQAFREFGLKIQTVGGAARPQQVYRAVHKDTPNQGIKARGHNYVRAAELFIQVQVQRHLNVTCHDLSPFMSVTSDIEEARKLCVKYEHDNCEGIEILTITTDGPDWDHTKSRMWHVPSLVEAFRLRKLDQYQNEYLIQDSIPVSCVERQRWDDIKDQHGDLRRKVAKKLKQKDMAKNEEARQSRKEKYAQKKNLLLARRAIYGLTGPGGGRKRCRGYESVFRPRSS